MTAMNESIPSSSSAAHDAMAEPPPPPQRLALLQPPRPPPMVDIQGGIGTKGEIYRFHLNRIFSCEKSDPNCNCMC